MSQIVFKDIGCLLNLEGVKAKDGRRISEADLTIQPKAAMVVDKGLVVWTGPQKNLPVKYKKIKKEVSLAGKTVMPGLVECHTHSLFVGSRAAEFELRNKGVSYQEIARQGGGILSTVRKVRKSSAQELGSKTQFHVDQFIAQGVSTLEIKSGYALNKRDEIKSLQVINSLKGPQIVATFLGCHAKPPEFESTASYVDYVIAEVLPQVQKRKLAQRVDIFIESGFYELAESEKLLRAAQGMGFAITIHADQLTHSGGTALALELGAQSADHVIKVSDEDIRKASSSDSVMVLLPTADLYMRCAYPPARKFIDQGSVVALATDFNPGTAPSQDLALVGLLARLEMKMTLPEVIAAYTYGAAKALGLAKQMGHLSVGANANFAVFEKDWSELFYSPGQQLAVATFRNGRRIYSA